MVAPISVAESVTTALKESSQLPRSMMYSVYELDQQGAQSNVTLPVVEVTILDTPRSRPHNTDLAGYVEDSNGNHIGRIYHVKFEMTLQIDVWTAEGSGHDPYELGQAIRSVLYPYDIHVQDEDLPDPDSPSTPIDDVVYFSIGDGTVANDLSMTHALRRWRNQAEVWFYETVETTADPVTEVVSPEPGQYEADGTLIEYDATPNEESAADTN